MNNKFTSSQISKTKRGLYLQKRRVEMQKWAFVSFSAPKTELKITYRKLHHPIHYDLQIFLIKSLYPQQV